MCLLCPDGNATAVKTEADNDDVMECLFAHYQTSAEMQHGEVNSDSLDSTNNMNITYVYGNRT